jgi:hypothetical protein
MKLLFANFAHQDRFHAQVEPPANETDLKIQNESNFSLLLNTLGLRKSETNAPNRVNDLIISMLLLL